MRRVHAPARALAALALLACARQAPPTPAPAHPEGEVWLTDAQVRAAHMVVEPLALAPLMQEVILAGKVTFNDQQVAHVYSPVTGRVVSIDAALGQSVARGDALATIASPDMGQFSAERDKARAALLQAEHEFSRQRALYEAHAGARRDFEAAEDAYLRAQSEVRRSQQKVDLLGAGAARGAAGHPGARGPGGGQRFVLRAPIAGEVVARAVYPGMEIQGQYAGGNAALELFTVGSLDSVWVMADLFEMDVARVQRGQPLRIASVAYPDTTFTGSVDWVSAAIDPVSRTAKMRSTVGNRDARLKPEMLVTVAVQTPVGAPEGALGIPRRAVFRLGGRTYCFVRAARAGDAWRFERRAITVDADGGAARAAVRAGLRAGEQVVTEGGILLADLF